MSQDKSQAPSHPIAGGLFISLALGLIAYGAYAGVMAQKPDPEKVAREIMIGVELGQKGELEAAAMQLAGVLLRNPDNTDALFNLGVAQMALERYEDADQLFQRVLELDSSDQEAIAERAGILQHLNRSEEALTLLEKIPAGAGRVQLRLTEDPLWEPLKEHPRMAKLLVKHGVVKKDSTPLEPAPAQAPPEAPGSGANPP